MSDSWQSHGLQHTRLPCLSLYPRVCSNSYIICSYVYVASPVSLSLILFLFLMFHLLPIFIFYSISKVISSVESSFLWTSCNLVFISKLILYFSFLSLGTYLVCMCVVCVCMPIDEGERGEGKTWLKTQHSKNNHGIWSCHFMENRWGKSGNSGRFHFLGLQNHWGQWLQPWN